MKGIITAGGLGTRLRPLTYVTNKHLLPVYDRPMVYYPIETLRRAGVTEIMIVCGKENAGHFMNVLGSGKDLGVKLSYALQHGNGGIAEAVSLCEDFGTGSSVSVILGDNIFEDDFVQPINRFESGAMIFLKRVPNPARFGVPVFNAKKKILRIEEKPKKPKSPFAQTGFFIFDADIFDIIRALKPSARGELEITDAVNAYLQRGKLSHSFVKGFWSDAGTFETLLSASHWVSKQKR